MSANVQLNPGVGGKLVRTDEIGGAQYELVKITLGVIGVDDGPVSATNPLPVTGVIATGGLTDAQLRATPVPVSAASLPLPTGAATEATLSDIETDVDAILSTQTDGTQVTAVNNFPAVQPVSGTVAVSNFPATQPVSGTVTANQGTGGVSAWKVDGSAVTQPVSAAALPLPAGASTSANQATGNASLASIDTKLTAPLSVTGPLTDTQLRASAVPVSAASLPLPSGASTSALQTTGNTSLASIDSKLTSPITVTGPLTDAQLRATAVPVSAASLPLPTGAATEATLATRLADATFTARINTLGQKTSANSTPVVIASDQSAVPISGSVSVSNFPATQPVSGTVTANQGTGGASAWKVDGSAVTQPISAASLPLPTGASTSALQTTGNTSLASIDGKLPAALVGGRLDENVGAWLGSTAPTVGSKTSANSVPVVIASDQGAVAISGPTCATATRTSPTVTNVVSTVLASNASRKGATFFNDSSSNVFLALGTAATTSDFTARLQANDYYEVPFGYTGAITAIKSSGSTSLRVTELT